MQGRGYRIIPGNPRRGWWPDPCETGVCLQDPFPRYGDIVDVCRRSEFLPDVARDFIETDAKIFWAQLELENQEAEEDPSWSCGRGRYRHEPL
ncbi:MAG: CoA-binding protein [Streptococcus parasanguinis]